jgi:hypothetical protein
MKVVGLTAVCVLLQKLYGEVDAKDRGGVQEAIDLVSTFKGFEYHPWADVRNALPRKGTLCVVYGRVDHIRHYDLAIFDGDDWEFGAGDRFAVSYWMELTEVPDETARPT